MSEWSIPLRLGSFWPERTRCDVNQNGTLLKNFEKILGHLGQILPEQIYFSMKGINWRETLTLILIRVCLSNHCSNQE